MSLACWITGCSKVKGRRGTVVSGRHKWSAGKRLQAAPEWVEGSRKGTENKRVASAGGGRCRQCVWEGAEGFSKGREGPALPNALLQRNLGTPSPGGKVHFSRTLR